MEKSKAPSHSDRDGDGHRLMLPSEVRRRAFEAGVRDWKKDSSLAAASRRGDGPTGRILISGNRAGYDSRTVEAWIEQERGRRAALLTAMQERAAVARAARLAKRAAPEAAADALIDALDAVVSAAADAEEA